MARRAIFSFSLLVAGCFPSGEGVDPPGDRSVYFPVGLALDSGNNFLYIANSDFDLQYNAGTVSSWNLATLDELRPRACTTDAECDAARAGTVCDVPPSGGPAWCVDGTRNADGSVTATGGPCRDYGELSAADRQIYPGRCGAMTAHGRFLTDTVEIGAFATDVVYRARPTDAALDDNIGGDSGRLFIPVRGDATLHWIDVDAGGKLHCGQPGPAGACAPKHRRGNDPGAENTRGAAMLPEPFGIDLNERGEWALVQLPSGREGWIESPMLIPIARD